MKLTILIFCLLAAACGREETPGATPGEQGAVEVAEQRHVGCDEYVEEALAVQARSREEFRSALGEPERTAAEATPNRHLPGATDTIFRLHYPGLVAQIRRPAPGGDLLESVEVTDNRHLRYPELGVGATADQITASLGSPQERTQERLLYVCGPEIRPEEPVIFLLEQGRVGRVRFTWYVD